MSGKQIGSLVGAAIGAYFGGAQGAQWGAAIGGMIGGAVAPDHINGPKIGDGQQQSATDGNPIAWVQGTAMVAGTIVQVSTRRQIRHKQDVGKGSGTVAVSYTAEQDFAILVCESCELRNSTVQQIVMVLQDGQIVYDVRPGSKMLLDSYKWKQNVDFYYGGEGQLPHPTMEASTGVGNTPAYRGSCVAIFKKFDLSAAGNRIPSFSFVVAQSVTYSATDLTDTQTDLVIPNGTGGSRPQYQLGGGYYDFPLDSTANREVLLDGFDNEGALRYYIRPLYSAPDPQGVGFQGDGVVPFLTAVNTIFDTGWYAYPSATPWRDDPNWTTQWSDLGIPVPDLEDKDIALARAGYVDGLGVRLTLPPGTQGLRITVVVSGSSSAPPFSFAVTVAQATMDLEYLGDGRYADASGVIHLSPWTTNRNGSPQSEGVSLAGICTRIVERGGLDASDIDVTELTDVVAGYTIARQANAADCLRPLLQPYFAFASEYDAKLRFKYYGADAEVTIDRADLIEGNDANDGAITSNLRNQSTEFPRRVVGSYTDPSQNYTVVNVAAERQAADVIAIGDQSFGIPVVMAADAAAQAVNKALKVAYATLEGTQEFSVPFAGSDTYLRLAAGEPVIFQGKRWVADENIIGNGSLKLTLRYDRQSAYTSNVQAILGNAPITPASPYSGPTTLIPMNLPAQRPQDSVGVYLVAASTAGLESWRGCTVQVSYDGTESWQTALQIVSESDIGTVTVDEPAGGEPLTVDMVKPDLESATLAQLAVAVNAFAVVGTDGAAQLGQFATATETATPNRYELTGVSRSLGGTTASAISARDRFTLMDAAYFLPIDPGFAGRTIYFRGVGFGETAETAEVVSLVYSALVAAPGQQRVAEDGTPRIAEDGVNLRFTES